MSYPRGILMVLVTLLVVTSELANGFMKLGVNHLLVGQKLRGSKSDVRKVETKWIEQPLDHYDSSEKRTFKIRYFERLDFWQPNGPIYVFICAFGDPSNWISDVYSSFIVQMAKDTNGYLLATDHRYYGRSHPDIPNDNKTEYYKFLSSQQALADVAHLIKSVKSDPKYKSSKVVVVGGSYEGNLAAWMREFYPDLVDAAVAAGAPVLAQKDFKELFEGTAYTFGKYGGENCLNYIETYYKRCEKLLQSSDGIETLKREMHICPTNNLTIYENQQTLFAHLYNGLAFFATIGYPRLIKRRCQGFIPRDQFMVDLNFGKHAGPFPLSQGCPCLNVDFNSLHFDDPWTYQFCTEFGYLATTTSEKKPFIKWNPLEYLLKYCKEFIKGDIEKKIDEGVARTNKMYGGKQPNVTKVVFTYGDMDPWHVLGVLQDLGPDAPVIRSNGTSQYSVLLKRNGESEVLKKVRKDVIALIKKWITTP